METMFEKVGAVGGNMGGIFDDDVFDGVKKIIVGKDLGCVSYIKIEYEKDGKFQTREHGTIRGELAEFAVDYPNEYITLVGGTYGHVRYYEAVLIKSLFFRTTYARTSPKFGGSTDGTSFVLEGKNGGKLLGFHGRSGQALDAIGPYFFTVNSPLKHYNREGGNGGSAWDDGAYDGVRKVLVGRGGKFVSYVRFEYAKGERMVPHAHGKRQEAPQEFVVDYPNEHITLVEGTIDGYLTSLKFKTSKGRTSPAFGNVVGRKFVFEENSFMLVGLCGRSGDAIDALGAHFGPLPAPAPIPTPPAPVYGPTSAKMGPLGGNKGNIFDDGIFDGVKKVTVGIDEYSVTYIKIEYEKDGNVETREHGTKRGEIKEFSVDYPKENITAVGGSYKHIFNYDTTLITSLYFTTSNGFTSPKFGETRGTEFNLKGTNGGKLIGFHGCGGHAIDAIGGFFDTSFDRSQKLSEKMGPIGGNKGNTFNDGVFDGVRKVTIGKDIYSVTYIKIEYAKHGNFETHEHGTNRGELKEFLVDYPNAYITAVGGSYKHIFNYDTTLITSLYFTLSNGFTSPMFGETKGTEFNLKGTNGGKLVGFHGRGGQAIDAMGAFFDTGKSRKLSQKMGLIGGNKGNTFDDGVFDGVRKIIIGKDVYSVTYIKTEYANDGNFETREHGTNRGELNEFSVDYPNEYITAVGGSYKHIFNYDTTLITSLYFTLSSGRTSPMFGETKGTEFNLKGTNGGKFLGFRGRGGYAIDAIGAYFETGSSAGET